MKKILMQRVFKTDMKVLLQPLFAFLQTKLASLHKTDSQIDTINEIWFIEAELKQLNTPKEFINWVCNNFATKYYEHTSEADIYLGITYFSLGEEIVELVNTQICFSDNDKFCIDKLKINGEVDDDSYSTSDEIEATQSINAYDFYTDSPTGDHNADITDNFTSNSKL